MGEAFAGKMLGKKAMLWGALAQSIPDIDFLASFWMDTSSNLLAHRGFTHSFLFCLIITPLFALAAEYWHRPHNISLKHWMLFFGAVIFGHIFLFPKRLPQRYCAMSFIAVSKTSSRTTSIPCPTAVSPISGNASSTTQLKPTTSRRYASMMLTY